MVQKRSLRRQFLIGSLLLSWVPILILSVVWIHAELKGFHEASEGLRSRLKMERKTQIEAHVQHAVDYVTYMRLGTENALKASIRSRVEETATVISGLVQAAKGHSTEQLQENITSALRNVRYNEGRGYFFLVDLQGVTRMNPVQRYLEGTNQLNGPNPDVRVIVQRLLTLVKEQGGGFLIYDWDHPHLAKKATKISYVKLIPELNWVLGTGEYVETVERDTQKKVIARLQEINFANEGYIFAGTYDARGLWGKFAGQPVTHLADQDGTPIIPRLIDLAKKGGGFIEYMQPQGTGKGRAAHKISYVNGIPEWGWYLGAGLYIDDIDQEIARKYDELRATTTRHIVSICLVLLTLGGLSFFVTFYLAKSLRGNIQSFADFFNQAAETLKPINHNALSLEEFSPLANAANDMIAARCKTEDALKENEQEQRKLRQLLRNVLDSMEPSIIGLEDDMSVSLISKHAEQLYAVHNKAEALGTPFITVFPTLAHIAPDIARAMTKGETIRLERIHLNTISPIRLTVTISPRKEEGLSGAVLVVEDVSERVRLDEVMVQTEKMLSVGGLAAGMAHEINNPLGGILQGVQNVQRRLTVTEPSNREALKETGVPPEGLTAYLEKRRVLRLLEGIRNSGERAARIVENMLKFSRKSQEQLTTSTLTTLVNEAVELATSDYDILQAYDFKKIDIVRDLQDTTPVICSPSEIEQVLLNLLRNAAQALHAQQNGDAAIVLRTSTNEDHGTIEIEDNGPGMPEHIRKRVFEPFFTTKAVGKGTGLGLSVSYFIITENHKGSFEVESTEGQGTRFIIKLPLRR